MRASGAESIGHLNRPCAGTRVCGIICVRSSGETVGMKLSVTLLFLASAVAQGAAADEPRPQTLAPVTVVPEADFARHPPLGAPAISPDGQHIAVSVHSETGGESQYQLAVLHLPDLKFVSRL